ncbi:hypothetical protein B9479_004452 [Cryptococcus floricola]|uniref:Uncharacterized protein n=1 Tax=Cryptococcus floricola TaxID=2591691 RepID=A0A5D3AXB1_9TREE|nr:hypothetical protein B9479_004452 [Cryptococcus floricola]
MTATPPLTAEPGSITPAIATTPDETLPPAPGDRLSSFSDLYREEVALESAQDALAHLQASIVAVAAPTRASSKGLLWYALLGRAYTGSEKMMECATHMSGAKVQAYLLVERCAVVPAREALAVAQRIGGDAWDVRIRNMGHLVEWFDKTAPMVQDLAHPSWLHHYRSSSKVKDTLAKALDSLADLMTSLEYPGYDVKRAIQLESRSPTVISDDEKIDSATTTQSEVDDALESASKAERRLKDAATVVSAIAAGLKEGAGWVPVVGLVCEVVSQMMESAALVASMKVSALGLVERCAIVSETMLTAIKDCDGKLPPMMQGNISQLMRALDKNQTLLSDLASLSKFQLWRKSGEIGDKISDANENVALLMKLFDIKSQITIANMLQTSGVQWKKDYKDLRSVIRENRLDGKQENEDMRKELDEIKEMMGQMFAQSPTTKDGANFGRQHNIFESPKLPGRRLGTI